MDREAIKQAVRDAADHQVACATMGYDLRGVHLLMEAAVEYLRITVEVDDDKPEATDPLPAALAALHQARGALDRAIAAAEKLTEGRKDWQ